MGTQEGAGAVWDNMTKIGRHETVEGESMDRHRKARCYVYECTTPKFNELCSLYCDIIHGYPLEQYSSRMIGKPTSQEASKNVLFKLR
ncbi:hypothetical protein G5I_03140 [Acromyrmex echinatior]|uniref:Uncharacterized protein n=1 Tax=Acromyrmex echinatior TaxID=103372 RepID=F4WC66_ACREC|nr:hypothetical protein G5I_03140 [Acromyrmex echinatior]